MPRHRRKVLLEVAVRDGWTCWICRMPVTGTLPAGHPGAGSLDHVIPRAMGGGNEMSNLRLAHRGCNSRRGASLQHLTTADRMSLRDRGTVARA